MLAAIIRCTPELHSKDIWYWTTRENRIGLSADTAADSVVEEMHCTLSLQGLLSSCAFCQAFFPSHNPTVNSSPPSSLKSILIFTLKPTSTMPLSNEICILYPGHPNSSYLLYCFFPIACFHLCTYEMTNLISFFIYCFFNQNISSTNILLAPRTNIQHSISIFSK